MNNLVSIIIPVYNVSEYLDRCVNSACRQTYSNIEIILVDDGSTDDCPEKCDKWAVEDKRVSVVHQQNGGLSVARNTGLDQATGKYIYFLDSDDYIEVDLLEKLVPILESNDADLVAFGTVMELNGIRKNEIKCPQEELVFHNDSERMEFIVEKFMRHIYGWEAWNRIFVRQIIEDNRLRFVDNKKIFSEDLYFSLCYLTHVKKMMSCSDNLYHYTIRNNSIMATNRQKLNINRFNELGNAVKDYYIKHDAQLLADNFYKIYFLIIIHQRNTIWPIVNTEKWKSKRIILGTITNKSFFNDMLRQFIQNKWKPSWVSVVAMEENTNLCKYLLNGNYLTFWFRNKKVYKNNKL